jgi:hypothetical protein
MFEAALGIDSDLEVSAVKPLRGEEHNKKQANKRHQGRL